MSAGVPEPESIPLVDLTWQHRQVGAAVENGWREVLASTAFILGPATRSFEEHFARFCGVEHCVGVANGTDAIELALRAVGVSTGDRIVVPANTFVATVEAVIRAGARPVFVDCDPGTYLIDVHQATEAMGTARAIVPVHLYGQLAPMREIAEAAARSGCVVVEDAAQAQGATGQGGGVGGWSAAVATSFYPGKNLGAYGDAGAVLTNDSEVAAKVRRLVNHGTTVKHGPRDFGFNSRLDEMQAVVLRAKLPELARWNALRRDAAARYQVLLSGDDRVRLPVELPGNAHVWHLYVVEIPHRDEVLKRLQAGGIQAGIHYPVPVHLEGPYREFGDGPGSMPVTEALAARILSLPIYPGITADQQERVVSELLGSLDAVGP